MDNISESVFTEVPTTEEVVDNPSLLTVIFELTPKSWYAIRDQITIQEITQALLVLLNAHLALNNSNQVAFIASLPSGSKFLHPNLENLFDDHETRPESHLVNKEMYRQFRIVDETVLRELNAEIIRITQNPEKQNLSTLGGALLMALTYTNRMLHVDQSISTTTASAINSTTNKAQNSSSANGQTTTILTTSMDSRVLIITANDTYDNNYIAIMNSIFAAQKMKLSIDVAKLGVQDSPYLQQAADATNGVYLHIREPQGLIQTLSTAFFIEPSIRSLVILPANSNVNYKASCFITGKAVDIGYVCSVCLCIMSLIPELGECPTCKSKFDEDFLKKLRRGPVIARKKRKVDENGEKEKTAEA
ncbi:CIC11C00000000758 [Sungouiella intermedia]|uniref:General transcription and DNA repair factor IIH subunit TFB4 n=1 Tax=Sungouiella intermedia TaxID=45354 RepID=A0A1L0BDD8_9ASCO|nr:CIC11C00000000758 [[Candida] intermedia]